MSCIQLQTEGGVGYAHHVHATVVSMDVSWNASSYGSPQVAKTGMVFFYQQPTYLFLVLWEQAGEEEASWLLTTQVFHLLWLMSTAISVIINL